MGKRIVNKTLEIRDKLIANPQNDDLDYPSNEIIYNSVLFTDRDFQGIRSMALIGASLQEFNNNFSVDHRHQVIIVPYTQNAEPVPMSLINSKELQNWLITIYNRIYPKETRILDLSNIQFAEEDFDQIYKILPHFNQQSKNEIILNYQLNPTSTELESLKQKLQYYHNMKKLLASFRTVHVNKDSNDNPARIYITADLSYLETKIAETKILVEQEKYRETLKDSIGIQYLNSQRNKVCYSKLIQGAHFIDNQLDDRYLDQLKTPEGIEASQPIVINPCERYKRLVFLDEMNPIQLKERMEHLQINLPPEHPIIVDLTNISFTQYNLNIIDNVLPTAKPIDTVFIEYRQSQTEQRNPQNSKNENCRKHYECILHLLDYADKVNLINNDLKDYKQYTRDDREILQAKLQELTAPTAKTNPVKELEARVAPVVEAQETDDAEQLISDTLNRVIEQAIVQSATETSTTVATASAIPSVAQLTNPAPVTSSIPLDIHSSNPEPAIDNNPPTGSPRNNSNAAKLGRTAQSMKCGGY